MINPGFLWLALIYGVAIAVGRRLNLRLPWKVAAFLYLVVLLFMWESLAGPFVNVPADYLRRVHPWRAVITDGQNRNGELNDVIFQMVPWAHQVRESWRNLEPPLWNSAAGGGYPLLANGQSAALSPFRLVNLPLPLGPAIASEAALKILFAATFTWLLLRRRRCSEAASLIGALSFGFSTFIIVWLNFPHAAVTAVLPAVIFGIDRLSAGWRWDRFAFLAGVFALLLLGGHPESAAHVVLAAGLWLLMLLALREASLRTVAHVTGAGLTGLVLAAPAVVPLLEALPLSQRMDWLREAGHAAAQHDPKAWIPILLHPSFFGLVRDGSIWGPGIAETVCGYAGILAAVGWLALTIHLVRGRLRDWRWYPVVTLPLAAAAAVGVPGVRHIVDNIPLFSLAANGRLRLVACFAGALAAAAVFDLLRGQRRVVLLSALVVTAVFASMLIFWPFPDDTAAIGTWLDAIPRLILLGVAILAASLRRAARPAGAALLIAVLADLWWFGRPWNPVVPQDQMFDRTPLIDRLIELNDEQREQLGAARIAGMGGTFFPNSAAMYGLEDIRAHDPMSWGRGNGVLRVLTRYTSDQYFGMLDHFEHPVIDFLNVALIAGAPLHTLDAPGMKLVYDRHDGRIWQNMDVMPRFFAPARVTVIPVTDRRVAALASSEDWVGEIIVQRLPSALPPAVRQQIMASEESHPAPAEVRILDHRPGRFELEIDARRWTLIASSQPDFPGWKIRRGDQRLKNIRINDAWLGFVVPPGTSVVTLTYQPRSFWISALVSIIAAALLLVAVLWQTSARRRADARISL